MIAHRSALSRESEKDLSLFKLEVNNPKPYLTKPIPLSAIALAAVDSVSPGTVSVFGQLFDHSPSSLHSISSNAYTSSSIFMSSFFELLANFPVKDET